MQFVCYFCWVIPCLLNLVNLICSLIANHRKLILPISGNIAWNSNHHNPGVNILKRNRNKDEKELLEFCLFKMKFNKCRILTTF